VFSKTYEEHKKNIKKYMKWSQKLNNIVGVFNFWTSFYHT
jgi:hypothetical protein